MENINATTSGTKAVARCKNATFMDYLMSQEEHVSQYYTEIDFLEVPVKRYEMIKSTNKVNIATDRGAIQFKGSLGFVIADEMEKYYYHVMDNHWAMIRYFLDQKYVLY